MVNILGPMLRCFAPSMLQAPLTHVAATVSTRRPRSAAAVQMWRRTMKASFMRSFTSSAPSSCTLYSLPSQSAPACRHVASQLADVFRLSLSLAEPSSSCALYPLLSSSPRLQTCSCSDCQAAAPWAHCLSISPSLRMHRVSASCSTPKQQRLVLTELPFSPTSRHVIA